VRSRDAPRRSTIAGTRPSEGERAMPPVTVITGTSTGIGFETALLMARRGPH
jgi:NADP-dependent 3-hydroxy acid dehydrogenase YdfG